MKTLLLMRHAKSSWDDHALADHDRPLNERGLRDAPRMGKLIKKEGLQPDLIITSTARRALDTAIMVAEACGYHGTVRQEPRIYEAPVSAFYGILKELEEPAPRVLLVGHNPGFEQLLANLTGTLEPMPTACLAHLELPLDNWKKINPGIKAKLVHIYRPKEI